MTSDNSILKKAIAVQLEDDSQSFEDLVEAITADPDFDKSILTEDPVTKIKETMEEMMLSKLYITAIKEGQQGLMQAILNKSIWAKEQEDREAKTLDNLYKSLGENYNNLPEDEPDVRPKPTTA